MPFFYLEHRLNTLNKLRIKFLQISSNLQESFDKVENQKIDADNFEPLLRELAPAFQTFNTLDKLNQFDLAVKIIYDEYQQQNKKYKNLGWLLSFIPYTQAFNARIALGNFVGSYDKFIKNQLKLLAGPDNFSRRSKLRIKTYLAKYFPNKWKTAILFSLGLALIAIMLLGVGGLATAGVFSSLAAGFFITKSLMAAFAAVASYLPILATSGLVGSAVLTGISGWLALNILHEAISPGRVRNLSLSSLERVDNNYKASPLNEINRLFPILAKDNLNLQRSAAIEKSLYSLFNPFRWLYHSLNLITFSCYRLIDLGTKPGQSNFIRRSLKGILHLIHFGINMPISFMIKIGDLPFSLIKVIFYNFPKYLHCSFSKPTEDISASENVARSTTDDLAANNNGSNSEASVEKDIELATAGTGANSAENSVSAAANNSETDPVTAEAALQPPLTEVHGKSDEDDDSFNNESYEEEDGYGSGDDSTSDLLGENNNDTELEDSIDQNRFSFWSLRKTIGSYIPGSSLFFRNTSSIKEEESSQNSLLSNTKTGKDPS